MQRARGGGVNAGPGRKRTQDVECEASSTCTGTLDASPRAVLTHTVAHMHAHTFDTHVCMFLLVDRIE
jgi:hypothetical protein